MDFFIDSKGFARAVLADEYRLLGQYLIDDVQGDVSFCDELLSIIDEIESNMLENWEGTGNAHTLLVKKDAASIVNQYTDEVLNGLPLTVLKATIIKWREFVLSSGASPADRTKAVDSR